MFENTEPCRPNGNAYEVSEAGGFVGTTAAEE
jgi:hypothetical protein